MKVDICYFVGCPDFVLFTEVYPGGSVTESFMRDRANYHESLNPTIWARQCFFETKKVGSVLDALEEMNIHNASKY